MEIVAQLNSIYPLSSGLTGVLHKSLKIKALYKKDYLLRAGHICRYIYFIEKGFLCCFYNKGGHEVCSWFMKKGDSSMSVEEIM